MGLSDVDMDSCLRNQVGPGGQLPFPVLRFVGQLLSMMWHY